MNRTGWAGALLTGALVLTACSGTGQEETDSAEEADLTIAVISHGAPDDAFWSVVKEGADRAGSDLGVTVEYNASPEVNAQAELVQNAIAQEVDGIVVSMANPDGMKSAVTAAVDAGIPVITMNSGLEESEAFGAITHVGQSETIAGEAAGERFNQLGSTKLLCIIHEQGNIGLEQRCSGAAKTFEGQVENLQVEGAETAAVTETVLSKLQTDDAIDGLLALNGQVALGADDAVQEAGLDATVGTFDLSTDVLQRIQDGSIAFAVDQQPFLQGYLGVQFLYLKAINGNEVGGGQPVYSGPAFVTKENAAEVAEFAEQGTR